MSAFGFLVPRLRLPLVRRCLATQPPNIKPRTNLPSDFRQPTDPLVMPVLDPSQLSEAEQIYIKRFEDRHLRNVDRRARERRRARVIGLSFGALVIAIYVYTIVRVRQETFLDDFDIPEPPPQKKAVEHD